MEKQKFLALSANPNLIAGIYNYCDGWCERCGFTSRCLNYISRKAQDEEFGDLDEEAFLEKLTDSFALAHELLADHAEEHGINLDFDEQEMDALMEKRKEERLEAKKSEISTLANQYMMLGSDWLKRCQAPLKEKEDEFNQSHRLGLGETNLKEQAKSISDALEVVTYYIHQIYVKLTRAQSSRRNDDAWFEENDFPKDSDGSAKVALIGIDRSIQAWSVLFQQLPAEEDALLELLGLLDQLRKSVEITFPNARSFIRPGLDQG